MSAPVPAPVPPQPPARLQGDLDGWLARQRTPEHARAHRLVTWVELLTSLWAPITVLGLLLVPYLFVVEYSRASHAWAPGLMRVVGAGLFFVFVALLLWRLASAHARTLKRLRRELHELRHDARVALQRGGDQVPAPVAQRVGETVLRAEMASLEGDASRLQAELKTLAELTHEHLRAWRRGGLLDVMGGFGKALLVALAIRTLLIEPYRIPSASMMPTLEIGDQVFVNKFVYGVRLPFTNWVPFVIVRPPMRGDVIVFNNPVDTSVDYIKRVIGVPGDTIEVRDEVVYVNGQPNPLEPYADAYTVHNLEGGQWFDEQLRVQVERAGDVDYLVGQVGPRQSDSFGPYVVPEGQVFVMGDNRDRSQDSRLGLGAVGGVRSVPYGHIKGKAMIIWFALGYGGKGAGLFGLESGLRLDRFFQPVR